MKISDAVDQLLKAAAASEASDRLLREKHGIDPDGGLDVMSSTTTEYIADSREQDDPVRNFVDSLSDADAKRIGTYMYGGRDHNDLREAGSFAKHYEGLRLSPKDMREAIWEKASSYEEYFRRAAEVAKELGIDVDEDLSKIT